MGEKELLVTAPMRRLLPRWVGGVASVAVLVIVAGTVLLNTVGPQRLSRVRERIPGLASGPVPTVTPAGLVISLADLPESGPTIAPSPSTVPSARPAGTPTARNGAANTTASAPAALGTAPAMTAGTNGAARPVGSAMVESAGSPAMPAPAGAPTGTNGPAPVMAMVAAMPVATPAPMPPVVMAPPSPMSMPVPPMPTALMATNAPPAPTATPEPTAVPTAVPTVAPTATPAPPPLPRAVLLQPMTHWFQTLNNCSGAATSMAVSYFGLPVDPLVLNTMFRPNQADKSVEPAQLVQYLQTRGLKAQVMEGGTIERMKRFAAAGVPVIAIQWLNRTDHAGVGHYRVVRGYDDAKQVMLVNDSMVGGGVPLKYSEFDDLWGFYNFRYIPVWNDKLAPAVARILGEDMERETNVKNALAYMQERVAQQPQNAELQFGLGGAYFVAGDDERALEQFRKARDMGLLRQIPFTILYQFWPVVSLVNTGEYDEALQISQSSIASAVNFAELRYERGRVFEARGDTDNARREFRAALVDDKNFLPARTALSRLGG